MGLLKGIQKMMKSGSLRVRDRDDHESAAAQVQKSAGSTPKPFQRGVEDLKALADSRKLQKANSFTLHVPVPRIDSVTTIDTPGSRFETTIVEREGSKFVLQGVKQLKADSDEEEDFDGLPPARMRRKPNRVASLPMVLDGSSQLPRIAGATPAPARGERNDVEGLAAGFSGRGMTLQDDEAEDGDAAAAQHRARRGARPPRTRRESLKALLNLDQYHFNEDVNVSDEAAMLSAGLRGVDGLAGTSGRGVDNSGLDHLLSANGTTTAILAVSDAVPIKMRRKTWCLDDYVLMKQLHKGYASDVYQARCKYSGDLVALKVYKLAEQGDIQRMQLYREIKLHSTLRHTNIIQFYVCFLERSRVVLVQEFAGGGDLLRYMYQCGGRLFERQAVNMVLQPFLQALHYMHTQGIVHRDIKPENVLFADNKTLKLGDFGLAINVVEERANTRAGTLDYMAPEVLRCPTKKTPDENKENPASQHYHQGVDAWAVGVFAYELIVGVPPFKAGQMIDTARNIIQAQAVFPDSVSELAKDFIHNALRKHPGDRPTVIEMLHHPWVTMFQRRSSVRSMYTRSNSLMEIMKQQQAAAAAAGGGASGAASPLSPTAARPTPRTSGLSGSGPHLRHGVSPLNSGNSPHQYQQQHSADEEDGASGSGAHSLPAGNKVLAMVAPGPRSPVGTGSPAGTPRSGQRSRFAA